MIPSIDPKELQKLAQKYRAGTISENERIRFDNWFNEISSDPLVVSDSERKSHEEHRAIIFSKIQSRIVLPDKKISFLVLFKKLSVAAIIVFLLGLTTWYYIIPSYFAISSSNEARVFAANELGNTRQTSTLKLANGNVIALDAIKKGEVIQEAGLKIEISADGFLSYQANDSNNADLVYHEIRTTSEEQIQLLLPDDSKVWLNAGSTLRFPTSFSHTHERKVFLSGEAYFEVQKKVDQPFRVVNGIQIVEVLGTEFNVSCYEGDKSMKTTLVNGKVKINNSTIISPDQQATSFDDKVIVKAVKAIDFIQWKNGVFSFQNETIVEVMRKISRWYDVKVSFQSQDMLQVTFTGTISKDVGVKNVLRVLEESSELKFNYIDNKIIVGKK